MGQVFSKFDMSSTEELFQKVSDRVEKEEGRNEELAESYAFNIVMLAKKYDDWFLDPIVGFVLPGVGDMLSAAAMLPGIYVSMFKLRSIKLTLAIFCCGMIDLLVGCIPVVGDLVDAFYKSNKLAARLIIGYAEKDPDTISEINKKAGWGVVILAILALIMYAMYEVILGIYNWIGSL